MGWPQMGPGGFFLANPGLANNLGRTDLDFDNFHVFHVLDPKFSCFSCFSCFAVGIFGLLAIDGKHLPSNIIKPDAGFQIPLLQIAPEGTSQNMESFF